MQQIMLEEERKEKVPFGDFDFNKCSILLAVKGTHVFILTSRFEVVSGYVHNSRGQKVSATEKRYNWCSFYAKSAISMNTFSTYGTRERAVAEALSNNYNVINFETREEMAKFLLKGNK